MNNQYLPRIKQLFFKLHNAAVWAKAHPQSGNEQLWIDSVMPTVEGYCDQLATLGVPVEFSRCLFAFGVDYLTAYRSVVLTIDK
jgi:hypothetical protein